MYIKYKGKNYEKAHKFFGLKKGDGLVLHHKDKDLIKKDLERYNEWRTEDLIVLTRAEHAKIHRIYQKDSEETKSKRALKLKGKHWGSWYKNEKTNENKYIKFGEQIPSDFIKGRIISKESIDKMSITKKGKPSWNKGKRLSLEHIKKLSTPIFQIKDGVIINRFFGANEAERQTKISQSHINQCCRGKRLTAGGYKWQYAVD